MLIVTLKYEWHPLPPPLCVPPVFLAPLPVLPVQGGGQVGPSAVSFICRWGFGVHGGEGEASGGGGEGGNRIIPILLSQLLNVRDKTTTAD